MNKPMRMFPATISRKELADPAFTIVVDHGTAQEIVADIPPGNYAKQFAEKIVLACNSHDDLVQACQLLADVLGAAFNQGADPEPVAQALTLARTALAKALP